jgi:hypothetical protein
MYEMSKASRRDKEFIDKQEEYHDPGALTSMMKPSAQEKA